MAEPQPHFKFCGAEAMPDRQRTASLVRKKKDRLDLPGKTPILPPEARVTATIQSCWDGHATNRKKGRPLASLALVSSPGVGGLYATFKGCKQRFICRWALPGSSTLPPEGRNTATVQISWGKGHARQKKRTASLVGKKKTGWTFRGKRPPCHQKPEPQPQFKIFGAATP